MDHDKICRSVRSDATRRMIFESSYFFLLPSSSTLDTQSRWQGIIIVADYRNETYPLKKQRNETYLWWPTKPSAQVNCTSKQASKQFVLELDLSYEMSNKTDADQGELLDLNLLTVTGEVWLDSPEVAIGDGEKKNKMERQASGETSTTHPILSSFLNRIESNCACFFPTSLLRFKE